MYVYKRVSVCVCVCVCVVGGGGGGGIYAYIYGTSRDFFLIFLEAIFYDVIFTVYVL